MRITMHLVTAERERKRLYLEDDGEKKKKRE
jgi:hypothetical protein